MAWSEKKSVFVDAFFPSSGGEVNVNVNATVGGCQTFVLDFVTANATSVFIGVGKFGGIMTHMQMDVTGGHILVPVVAAQAAWYLITVKAQQPFWTFYSVEVDTLK